VLHRFECGSVYLVLDVNSGALHRVSRVAWEILASHPWEEGAAVARYGARFGADAVRAALEEIAGAVRRGNLLAPPPPEVRPNGGPSYLRALCLHLAHACNMRCGYCFAGQGQYGGGPALMSRDVALRAIDFLLCHSGPQRRLDVDFFGGEPLLNLEVLKETVAYGLSRAQECGKKISFTVTTNGLLLDDRTIDFLNQQEITVIASLDGRPAVHDRWRRLADGRASYERVLPGIRALIRSRAGRNYYVRGTYTRQNLDFAADVRHLAGLGIDRVSLEPVVAPPTVPYGLRASDLPAIREQYLAVAEFCYRRAREGRPFSFFHFELDILRGPCLKKRVSGCGAGHAYLAVAPDGSLYPCHQFVGQPAFRLGSVWADNFSLPPLGKQFRQLTIYEKAPCRECWAKFLCSGGCHANNYALGGGLDRPWPLGCALTRIRLEAALYLQARLAELRYPPGEEPPQVSS